MLNPRLRSKKGESASSCKNESDECYQRKQGVDGSEVTKEKLQDWPTNRRSEASNGERLWAGKKREVQVRRTPALETSPEALGIWQKMLAEAREEMYRHRQDHESSQPQEKRPQAQGKAWGDNSGKSKDQPDQNMFLEQPLLADKDWR